MEASRSSGVSLSWIGDEVRQLQIHVVCKGTGSPLRVLSLSR